jgi:large subunit ribosomal protein L18
MDKKHELRQKRHARVRRKVAGTSERPRLAVFRSVNHIYAQVIDDSQGKTLAAASTMDPELRKSLKSGGNVDAAKAVGKLVGERAKERGVEQVVFDRGGFMYHGRVQSLAEAAREAGLQF